MEKLFILLLGLASLKLPAQEVRESAGGSAWNFSAWAEMFIIPGEDDIFNPTFYARHKTLHLEGRFNYEDLNTASVWAGKRFTFGKPVEFVVVPMGAIVFGRTNGVAPGLETEIMYKKFDFYAESEYVFDFRSQENNFFYMYSELAIRPVRPLRTGIIAQRTKLYEADYEVQHGLFAEYYFGKCRAGVFYFSPFHPEDNFWIASFSVDF